MEVRPDASHLVVSGDSCGGLLGLGTILAARDEGLALAGVFRLDLGLVRLSPWPQTPTTAATRSSRRSGCATGAGTTPPGGCRWTTRNVAG